LNQYQQKSSSFHIHLDGAVFPHSLQTYAREKYGFHDDDFDHRLVTDQGRLPGKHLTLKIADRYSAKNVRAICEDMAERAHVEGYAGLIQSEFIMNEVLLESRYTQFRHSPFPFYVHMRKVDPSRGEEFKTHELHLELLTDQADARLITELARSGLSVAFAAREISFTAAGSLNDIRKIQEGMLDFLKRVQGFERAKLVIEATVFHSLHQMVPENTPLVVDRVEYLQ
jgi:hypothetical protein